MKNKKGFTLIELLAVIVILGLLMAIAIPSVTKYITQSRKKTVTSTIGNYIGALVNDVNDLSYTFTEGNTVYAVPIECIALERGGTNPFGAWHQSNNAYWAYVLVQYDDETSSYTYGYTFKDSAGYGIYPTSQSKLNEQGKQIQTGLELSRPKNGKVTTITKVDNWNGFAVNDTTNLVVLEAESEGNTGDGKSTCTLQQKGENYTQVEQEKAASIKTISLWYDGANHVFQYKEGMTWKDWINSKYNTQSFFEKNGTIHFEINNISYTIEYDCPVVYYNNLEPPYFSERVLVDDLIFEKVNYYVVKSNSSAGMFVDEDLKNDFKYYILYDDEGNANYIEN